MKWMEVADVINGNTDNYKNVIYMWRNKVNNKLYIGQAKDFRKRTKYHKYGSLNENLKYNYNVPLHKAIRKYGVENFEVCILEKDLVDYDKMNEKEIFYIEHYDTLANKGKGYNVASGGGNANVFAGKTDEEMDEIKRKISEVQKGENNPMYGRTGELSPISKAVICITTDVIYGGVHEAERQTGVGHQTISKCCCGKYKSAGLIDGKPGIWMYLEDYEKLSKEEINKIKNKEVPNGSRQKAVICITTGKIYDSTMDAERQTGVGSSNISECCRGKRKSAGKDENGNKLVWRYYNESL